MVKKIKFPLEMTDGIQVRTLEELREHFDMEKVLGYYADGKLLIWLNDRYYEDEAAQISELSGKNPEFKAQLCEILGVENNCTDAIDLDAIERRNAKLAKLKQFTDDDAIIKNVDSVAFDQEELSDLLDEELTTIYLCSERFTIPLSKENMMYIGIQSPTVIIKSKTPVDFVVRKISFQNIVFDEEYRKLTAVSEMAQSDEPKRDQGIYKTSSFLIMNTKDRAASEQLFNIIHAALSGIGYDADRYAKAYVEILKNAKLPETFERYLEKNS